MWPGQMYHNLINRHVHLYSVPGWVKTLSLKNLNKPLQYGPAHSGCTLAQKPMDQSTCQKYYRRVSWERKWTRELQKLVMPNNKWMHGGQVSLRLNNRIL